MKLGELGEQLAACWLETQGYQILHQGWSCRWGEIDLIAIHRHEAFLSFVEVKTRCDRNWDNNGLLAVDDRKQKKICQTAALFLAENPEFAELPCRFDVALVNYTSVDKYTQASYLFAKHFSYKSDRYLFSLQTYLKSAFELA